MGSTGINKPHAVIVPFPASGHVNPCLQLGKLLHSRGFHITFVNTEFQHKRYLSSIGPDYDKGLPDFRFEWIADGMPPPERIAPLDVPKLCDATSKNCLAPFKELITRLNTSADGPPVTCIIADGIMSFCLTAAREMGITEVMFYTTSACGFMGYLHFHELIKRGIVPFKDESYLTDGTLDTPIDWIPGMRNVKLKDLPTFMRVTDLKDIMFDHMGGTAQDCRGADALILNTFEELESEVMQAMATNFNFPHIFAIGPLTLLESNITPADSPLKSIKTNVWNPDSECFEWLDKRDPRSVVYVNYGSITVLSEQTFTEFAWGLANSNYPFLWIIRSNALMGDSPLLPKEYLEEIKDRGLLTSWCEQEKVLAHSSVGAFLTHCGWNSTVEGISGGVPTICWPFFAEQQTNALYLCNDWGTGVELNQDVKREEVEAIVREMMEGEKGKIKGEKAQEWKRIAEQATDIGGSSYENFNRFVKDVLHYDG